MLTAADKGETLWCNSMQAIKELSHGQGRFKLTVMAHEKERGWHKRKQLLKRGLCIRKMYIHVWTLTSSIAHDRQECPHFTMDKISCTWQVEGRWRSQTVQINRRPGNIRNLHVFYNVEAGNVKSRIIYRSFTILLNKWRNPRINRSKEAASVNARSTSRPVKGHSRKK